MIVICPTCRTKLNATEVIDGGSGRFPAHPQHEIDIRHAILDGEDRIIHIRALCDLSGAWFKVWK